MQYYMEVSIDGQKVEGRIVYEVFPDVAPLGARRWAELAAEREGVGYRLSKFDGIYDVSASTGTLLHTHTHTRVRAQQSGPLPQQPGRPRLRQSIPPPSPSPPTPTPPPPHRRT